MRVNRTLSDGQYPIACVVRQLSPAMLQEPACQASAARAAPKGAVFVDESVPVQKKKPTGDGLSFITIETKKGQPDLYADVSKRKSGERCRLSFVQHG